MSKDDSSTFEAIASLLKRSRLTVAFTGAGISTESGIADFRSPGGVWSRYQPVMFDEFLSDPAARKRYWAMKKESHAEFAGARPNIAHTVLADLEKESALEALITQNIDGLHQDAGSRHVLELHGTNRFVTCLDCDRRYTADEIFARIDDDLENIEALEVPTCDSCGGLLKPATVSFGQNLPADVLSAAERLSIECELFFAIGSSLVVHPAAALPQIARQEGADLVIINRDETPLDPIATHLVRTPIGEAMERIYGLYSAM